MKSIRLGDYISLSDKRNSQELYNEGDVRGISTSKRFISTKADLTNVSLKSYKLVFPKYFAMVSDTSRRGDKISLAFNNTESTYIVSSISTVFYVTSDELLPEYLFMYFNRPEFDRFSRYNSWGSARETFDWKDFCDITIDLPDVEIQKKYIEVYKSIENNINVFQYKSDDLKLVCDGFIEKLRREYTCESIGKYITEINAKNDDEKIKHAVGISKSGVFDSKRTASKDSIKGCKVLSKNNILWATQTTCGIGLGAVGIYESDKPAICAPTCCVISTNEKLNPYYLLLWLKRSEFSRYAIYYGSGVVDKFGFDLMSEVKIPIPDIEIQNAIVNIYKVYTERSNILSSLEDKCKNICSILLSGSLKEATNEQ